MPLTNFFHDIEVDKLRSVLWQGLWREEFHQLLGERTVVVVPIGSIEQHGPHCPPDVDISIPYCIAIQSALTVKGKANALVASPIWTGYSHYNMGFPGTLTISLETFQSLIKDVCHSIYQNGFRRIILLNGHGGNAPVIKSIATDLSQQDIYVLLQFRNKNHLIGVK